MAIHMLKGNSSEIFSDVGVGGVLHAGVY